MSKSYYNEFDPKAAAWLRELIKQGLIAYGDVDERSIIDVEARDIAGYSQCHFFAGIGGWSYALRLAGIPDSQPVWTASLPCQPFSVAGKGLGKSDERHLLPHFLQLVRQSKPKRLFGEQVAAAINHGWLDDLQAALEAEGYACGAAVLGAHSVGAFHQRQRLYWVADSGSKGLQGHGRFVEVAIQEGRERAQRHVGESSNIDWVGNTELRGRECKQISQSTGVLREVVGTKEARVAISSSSASVSCMGKSDSDGRILRNKTTEAARYRNPADAAGWANPDWIECRDNKLRPIKPGLEPLANGVPARVVRLRGYGNAIVPQVAALFIDSFFEIAPEIFG